MPRFNDEFSHPAREAGSAFVPLLGVNLDRHLCERHERVVGKDNQVAFQGLFLQLPGGLTSLSLREGESEGVETSGWFDLDHTWTALLGSLYRGRQTDRSAPDPVSGLRDRASQQTGR